MNGELLDLRERFWKGDRAAQERVFLEISRRASELEDILLIPNVSNSTGVIAVRDIRSLALLNLDNINKIDKSLAIEDKTK